MKSIMFTIAVLLSGLLMGQQPKSTFAKLDKATVYLQGAHLYYYENVNLLPGNNDLVFENISPYINEASMQANSKGGVVMDVKHLLQYKQKTIVVKRYDKEIQQVTDSIEDIFFDLRHIDNKMKALITEKTMLLNNRIIKGESQRDSLPILKDGMAFLKEKLNTIYEEELRWEKAKHKTEKQQAKLQNRLNALNLMQNGETYDNQPEAQPIHQLVVTVYSEASQQAQISFNYFVQAASWLPLYDLQATSASNALQLRYFAHVSQTSGIDWKNTALTLSTPNPSENNLKPELAPWYLSFIMETRKALRTQSYGYMSNSAMPATKETITLDKKKEDQDDLEEKPLMDYITVSENMIRTEYEIKLPYTISNDGRAHKVLINQRDVPMKLQYAAVPKISGNAFLMGRITGWEDMNILPGNARITFDGGYVGEMLLDATNASDTLAVNLGRDKTLQITRKKIKEKRKENFTGTDKTETRTIELLVRNTKGMSMEMLVEDQIPVVQGTTEIKVLLLDGDGADHDESTGKLSWKLKLGAKETKKIKFTYSITYPANKPVAGL